jgi:hypothetical protein
MESPGPTSSKDTEDERLARAVAAVVEDAVKSDQAPPSGRRLLAAARRRMERWGAQGPFSGGGGN